MKLPDLQKYLLWGLGVVFSGLSLGELAKANSTAILLNSVQFQHFLKSI